MVQFNENGDLNSQYKIFILQTTGKKVLGIQILSDPYNFARPGSNIFLVETDPDPTNYRRTFGRTPSPTRYAYTYEVQYTYEVHVHLKGTSTPQLQYENHIHLYIYKVHLHLRTRSIFTCDVHLHLLGTPYKYEPKQYENTTPAPTPVVYQLDITEFF